MQTFLAHPSWRKLRAGWRDSWLLLRQFRWPLLSFFVAIAGGGTLYFFLARAAGEPVRTLPEAIYQVLGQTFFQPVGEFPRTWYLELFYFVMPLIGIGILAQGFAEFGILFFNRRERGKEWEMAVASTFSNHIILVGLGHLGFRVARNLREMGQEVVVIEKNPKADLVTYARGMDVPVLEDDALRAAALEAAGVQKARSIILCTQNDSLNLQTALKARSLNPKIQVTLRIFDDDFAVALQEQFGFTAMSATGMAAPAFASAAAGVDMTRPIAVEGQSLSLARLNLVPASQLAGLAVEELEQRYNLSVVLLRREGDADLHPAAKRVLEASDVLAVLGGPGEIATLIQDNRPK